MYMTLRRLRAWPRAGSGFVHYGQQVRVPLSWLKFSPSWYFPFSLMAFRCKDNTTSSDGCLGSNNDDVCSEVWEALWIAGFGEPIESWTHIALSGYSWKHVCFSVSCFSACHSGVTFSRFHVSMQHSLQWHMCLGGAGYAQRWTSSSGVMLRVIKQHSVFFFWKILRHEVEPENLLNLSI